MWTWLRKLQGSAKIDNIVILLCPNISLALIYVVLWVEIYKQNRQKHNLNRL